MTLITSPKSNLIYVCGIAVLLSFTAICGAAPVQRIPRDIVSAKAPSPCPPPEGTKPDCDCVRTTRIANNDASVVETSHNALVTAYRQNGVLTYEDVKKAYEPLCDAASNKKDEFLALQAFVPKSFWPSDLPKKFSWCADKVTGEPLNTTAPLSEEDITCSTQASCSTDSDPIPHGSTLNLQCQTCTCSNGSLICKQTRCQPTTDNITLNDLTVIKIQLMKKMVVDFTFKKVFDSDSSDLATHMAVIADEDAIHHTRSREWTFDDLNSNNDPKGLTIEDTDHFVRDYLEYFAHHFLLLASFHSILNNDSFDRISLEEWQDFFNMDNNANHVTKINNSRHLLFSGSGK